MSGQNDQYGAFGNPMILPHAGPAPGPSVPPVPPSPPSGELDVPRFEIRMGHRVAGRELICEMRKTVFFLYDAFTELVRKIYRDNLDALVGTPTRKWGRTPQHDGIWIDTELNWKPEHPDFLPAVYTKLQDIKYTSILGDQNVEVGFDLENAVHTYSRVGSGTVSFVHVARTSGEAVALCDNTRFYLSDFGAQIADDLCLSKFFEAGVQPLSVLKDSKEAYASTTSFAFEFHEAWDIKHESPILRSVDLLQSDERYGILALHGTGRNLNLPPGEGTGHNKQQEETVDG